MLRHTSLASLIIALAFGLWPATASEFDDPEWPCVQRKVETLSAGVMWPHPIPEGQLREDLIEAGGDLVDRMVLRRFPVEEIPQMVTEFDDAHDDLTRDDLGLIFHGVFRRLNQERSTLIDGIARYSLSQRDLAARIDKARVEMDNQMAQEDPDFDAVDRLEEQIDWDERIYRDRAQSLTYVCETPVLLEKRAFAIAQALMAIDPAE